MGKQKVRILKRNWDVDFYDDLINGDGFLITEPAEISMGTEKRKAMYGPRSPLYGTSYEDEQSFIERYRCDCGEFKGKQFEGEICPICNTPVTSKGVNVKVTGWISLGESKIVNPYFYNLLCKLLGKKVFPDIIECRQKVDTDGHRSHINYDNEDYTPSSPYAGIGIESFLDQFDEIIDYFIDKKKNKAEELEKVKEDKSKVFTSHIPIYTTFLRPQSSTSDTFYYNGIDKHINPLFKLSESVKDCNPIERDFILYRIQQRVNEMWTFNFEIKPLIVSLYGDI